MAEKKTYKVAKNRVGYVSKSKTGKSVITVEQDITLKKGDKLILNKPSENIESLLKRGFIDEGEAEKRKSSIPDWKTHEVDVLPSKD
jgi:hypothetical protein